MRGVFCIKEIFVEVAGLAADLLNLPFPGLRATRVCRNKHLQRVYLREYSPSFTPIPPNRRDDIANRFEGYPGVLKPVGRNSSSGVQSIEDREALRSQLRSYPADEPLLLEAKIEGREYSVETLVQHGKRIFENVTQKRTNEAGLRFFVELAHTIPATNLTPVETELLLSVNQRVLETLSVQNGITHAEYRLTDHGQVYLMEVAARGPGDAIPQLYHLATGKALESALIDIALGSPTSYPKPVRYARQVYLEHPHGYLSDVLVHGFDHVKPLWLHETGVRSFTEPSAAVAPPSLQEVYVQRNRHEWLGEITNSFDRCTSFSIDAPTSEELDALEEELLNSVEIVTERAADAPKC